MADAAASAGRMPLFLSRFVGRQRQLEELTGLLDDARSRSTRQSPAAGPARLVTLTGVGGGGKTRLAHELSSRLATRANSELSPAADGVHWVGLESVADPGRVPHEVAGALGLAEVTSADPVEALVKVLHDRRALLVLDNCEHLAAACRGLVHTLLTACPQLTTLATSRGPLQLDEEVVYPVPPMRATADLPGAAQDRDGADAVSLFLDRASFLPADSWDGTELDAIELICQRLDGLPLAIELAASWFRVLSPRDLLAEIEQSIEFLSATGAQVAERHRSVDAVLSSTWGWLDPDDQQLLKSVTVLEGEFSRDAAVAVGGATLTSLSSLVDRSLIQRSPAPGGATRYRMHSLVRQFAARQLGAAELAHARQSHMNFFLSRVDKGAQVWETVHEAQFLDTLRPDRANLETALTWAISRGQAEPAVKFCAGLFNFWMYSAPVSEYTPHLEHALALPWPRAGVSQARVRTLILAGYAAMSVDDFDKAQSRFDEAHRLSTELRDVSSLAWALRGRGFHARLTGDAATASRDAGTSLTLCRAEGDRAGEAWSLHALGETAFLVGDLDSSDSLFEEALVLFDLSGVPFGAYRALTMLGAVARRTFRWRAAAERYQGALERQRHRHFTSRGADILEGIAEMAATLHQPLDAARLFGAADTWRRSFGYTRYLFDAADREQGVQEAQAQLSAKAWASALAEGQRLTSPQAIGLAQQCAADIAAATALRHLPCGLTEREVQVLHLVVLGLQNRAIAARLTVSPRTVHAHLRSIFEKLHVDSRTAAAHEAIKLKLG